MNAIQVFEGIAAVTWKSLQRAYQRRIHLGEEAITSYNLLTIDKLLPTTVVIEDTSVNESTKGADFEFWIGGNAIGWRRYAVQAKRLYLKSNRYDKLDHKVNGVLQLDILEQYASSNRAAPIYCFYNFSSSVPTSNCCSGPVANLRFGCSIAPSSTVRKAIHKRGGKKFDYIHKSKQTLPWHCLVKCPLSITRPSTRVGLADYMGENNFYQRLPEEVDVLRRTLSISEKLSDNALTPTLRPRWIGVVELDE